MNKTVGEPESDAENQCNIAGNSVAGWLVCWKWNVNPVATAGCDRVKDHFYFLLKKTPKSFCAVLSVSVSQSCVCNFVSTN